MFAADRLGHITTYLLFETRKRIELFNPSVVLALKDPYT